MLRPKRRSVFWLLFGFLLLAFLMGFGFPGVMRFFYPTHYQKAVLTAAKVNQLDPRLIFSVIRSESKFQKEARSHRGAMGLMQLMPATGVWLADRVGLSHFQIQDLYDPNINITLGSAYLAYLAKRYHGNLVAAVAAYNGGEHNVTNWINTKRWNGRLSGVSKIPFGETRFFVLHVFSAYTIYQRLYPHLS